MSPTPLQIKMRSFWAISALVPPLIIFSTVLLAIFEPPGARTFGWGLPASLIGCDMSVKFIKRRMGRFAKSHPKHWMSNLVYRPPVRPDSVFFHATMYTSDYLSQTAPSPLAVGFPSGHCASSAIILCKLMAYGGHCSTSVHILAVLLALFCVIGRTPFAKGVHSFPQVFAGFAYGLFWYATIPTGSCESVVSVV
jgi:hypothetical protein